MFEDQGIDLAISLDQIHLVDEFFHINAPTASGMQTTLSVTCPKRKFEVDREAGRLRLHAVVGVHFLMFNGPVPEHPTQEQIDGAVISFGCAAEPTVSSGVLSSSIPTGKHSTWVGDPESERDRNMERNMLLEAVRAAYALASSRMLQATSISPLGPVNMPFVDYDALLDQIERAVK